MHRGRIILDGRWIRVDSGIGHYAYWLARTLPSVAPDLDFETWLPASEDPLVSELASITNMRMLHIPGAPAGPRSLALAATRLFRDRPAIYHTPDWFGLPRLSPRCHVVSTIHDLIPLVAPTGVPRSLKARYPRSFRVALTWLARRASAVITDASSWATEISARLGIGRDRIHVVPLGVAPPTRLSSEEAASVARRFGVEHHRYVLAVGRCAPYKGIAALVRAFARVRAPSEKLVIAGGFDTRYEEPSRTIERLKLAGTVVHTGSVPPRALDALYAGAAAFATLSRYEGFGLPPLEAMARGVPVVASRIPVFQETLEEAALLVDPDDEREIGTALRKALDDAGARRRLIAAGFARARQYTWERCARDTAEIYRNILSERGAPARWIA